CRGDGVQHRSVPGHYHRSHVAALPPYSAADADAAGPAAGFHSGGGTGPAVWPVAARPGAMRTAAPVTHAARHVPGFPAGTGHTEEQPGISLHYRRRIRSGDLATGVAATGGQPAHVAGAIVAG